MDARTTIYAELSTVLTARRDRTLEETVEDKVECQCSAWVAGRLITHTEHWWLTETELMALMMSPRRDGLAHRISPVLGVVALCMLSLEQLPYMDAARQLLS